MHQMAEEINERFAGKIPQTREELLSLPGLSEYIVSAVRCFAWNKTEVLIDTNTVRVSGRLFGLKIKDSSRRNPRFREIIEKLVPTKNSKAYNYALLDLAALVCISGPTPECSRCPISSECHFYKDLRITLRTGAS